MREFEKNILNLYGQPGKDWLQKLPEIVREIADRYHLSALKPISDLSYHYVMSGFQGAQPIILKLGLDIDDLKREAAALYAFAGPDIVRVLAQEEGFLLLERIIPGKSLKCYFPLNDDKAMDIACSLMQQFHKPLLSSEYSFPHIKDWLSMLDRDWDIPMHYLTKAKQLRDRLLRAPMEEVLLHGDLHHGNILQNGTSWKVIDPKGVIGESAYEVAAFIRNPIELLFESNAAASIVKKRIMLFAKITEFPQSRILDWCFVQAVFGWVCALEDSCDVAFFKQLTAIFDEIAL